MYRITDLMGVDQFFIGNCILHVISLYLSFEVASPWVTWRLFDRLYKQPQTPSYKAWGVVVT